MDEKQQVEFRKVPLEWKFPEDLVSRYATNLVVQHTEHEFVISFFEVTPPVVLGEPEEVVSTIHQLQSVPATCVARIIVSPERLEDFIRVLEDNLETYLSKVE